jgi:hypothetical protein
MFDETFLDQGICLLNNIEYHCEYNSYEIILGFIIYFIMLIFLSLLTLYIYPFVIFITIIFYLIQKRINNRKQF